MGSPGDELGRLEDEGPQRRITIKNAVYIGKTDITADDFSYFVAAATFEPDSMVTGCYVWREGKLVPKRGVNWMSLTGYDTGASHSAVCLSWRDAVRYVQWLSAQTKPAIVYPVRQNEEFAARAGSHSARYWGESANMACDHANVADLSFQSRYHDLSRDVHHCKDGFSQTAPVASFPPNAYGLHDMLGNVWEWTCSKFAALTTGAAQE